MLTCAAFADRLYDEDCRQALAGRAPIPADLGVHRDGCASCRGAWEEAARDLAALPPLLLEPAPSAVVAGLRHAVAKGGEPSPALDWTAAITWAAIGASIGAVLPALTAGHLSAWVAGPEPLILSLVGASFAFAARVAGEAVREALG
jgi:hypothetical protein